MEVEKLAPQSPLAAEKRRREIEKNHAAIGKVSCAERLANLPHNVTEIKVLTQPAKGGTHRETEITIDWSEVTPEDLYSLARNALIGDAMARMVKADDFPEKLTVKAKDHVHKPSESVMKYTFVPKQVKIPKELEAFLSGLSKEEIKTLLGGE